MEACIILGSVRSGQVMDLEGHEMNRDMTSKFQLIGLSRKKSVTCSNIGKEDIFWPKVGISQEDFDQLWKYCENDWEEKKIAIIEHNGYYWDGTPKDAIFKGIELI